MRQGLAFQHALQSAWVELDLSEWLSGKVLFSNTEECARQLIASIDEVLEAGKPGLQPALVLRGRMQFAKALGQGV